MDDDEISDEISDAQPIHWMDEAPEYEINLSMDSDSDYIDDSYIEHPEYYGLPKRQSSDSDSDNYSGFKAGYEGDGGLGDGSPEDDSD